MSKPGTKWGHAPKVTVKNTTSGKFGRTVCGVAPGETGEVADYVLDTHSDTLELVTPEPKEPEPKEPEPKPYSKKAKPSNKGG